LRAQDGAFFDAHVIRNAYLSADYDVVFDDRTSGKAGLRGDDHVLADVHVVADVDEVVDFCAAADAGFV